MANRANIVINDGQATPAAHTYVPVGKPLGTDYEYFVERSSGVPNAQAEIRLRLRTPVPNSGSPYKVDATVLVPETAIVNGETVVLSQNRVDVTFTLSPKSTSADRADVLAFARNLLANAIVESLVEDLETIY